MGLERSIKEYVALTPGKTAGRRESNEEKENLEENEEELEVFKEDLNNMPNLNFLENMMRLKDMKNLTESKDRIDPRDMDPLKERWEIIKDELETSSVEAGGGDQMRTFHSDFIDPDLDHSHGDKSGEESTEDNASSEKNNNLPTNKSKEEEATDVVDNDNSSDKESSEQEDLESSEINIESEESFPQ